MRWRTKTLFSIDQKLLFLENGVLMFTQPLLRAWSVGLPQQTSAARPLALANLLGADAMAHRARKKDQRLLRWSTLNAGIDPIMIDTKHGTRAVVMAGPMK